MQESTKVIRQAGEEEKVEGGKNPLSRANFLSKFIINWAGFYVNASSKQPWEQHMYKDLDKIDTVGQNRPKFEEMYKRKKSIWGTVFALYRLQMLQFLASMVVIVLVEYSTALFLSNIVKEIELGQENVKNRMDFITINFICILIAILVAPIIRQYYYFKAYRLGYRVKAALLSMTSSKILNFSVLNSSVHKEGKILNYIQIDIMRVENVSLQFYGIILFGFSIIFGMILAYFMIKAAIFGILLMTVVMNLLYVVVYSFRGKITRSLMKEKDDRIEFVKAVLKNLEYVKLNCLENFYIWKIYKKREKEIKRLRQLAIASAAGFFVEWLTPGMTQLALCLYYMYLRPQDFNFAQFSAFLQIFEVIKRSTLVMNVWLNRFVEMLVSVKRINEFLKAPNIDKSYIKYGEEGDNVALKVTDGRFMWGNMPSDSNLDDDNKTNKKDESVMQEKELKSLNSSSTSLGNFELKNINFEVNKGEKVFIIGKSSSGKSSLLYSLLGEMTPKGPGVSVKRSGKVVFLAQDQWTFADTVKENITFGSDYSEERLKEALEMAQMTEDIKTMNQGLNTMLGDTGHTVSGGQRARLGLARCFYQK